MLVVRTEPSGGGDDAERRSRAGIRVHLCQDAQSLEHNEATVFSSSCSLLKFHLLEFNLILEIGS